MIRMLRARCPCCSSCSRSSPARPGRRAGGRDRRRRFRPLPRRQGQRTRLRIGAGRATQGGQRYGWILNVRTACAHSPCAREYLLRPPPMPPNPPTRSPQSLHPRPPPQPGQHAATWYRSTAQIFGEWSVGADEPQPPPAAGDRRGKAGGIVRIRREVGRADQRHFSPTHRARGTSAADGGVRCR